MKKKLSNLNFATVGSLQIKVIEATCSSFESNSILSPSGSTSSGYFSNNTSPKVNSGTEKPNKFSLSISRNSSQNSKNSTVTSANIIVDILVLNADSSVLHDSASAPTYCSLLPQYGAGNCLIGEELTVKKVSSLGEIHLTLRFESDIKLNGIPKFSGIIGIVDIPLNRLQSSVPVSIFIFHFDNMLKLLKFKG